MTSDRMFIGKVLMSLTSCTIIIIMNSYVVSRWNYITSYIKISHDVHIERSYFGL